MEPTRRSFLGAAAATLAWGPSFWRAAYADPAVPGPGPYGALRPPDANGLMLPTGFTSRVVARAGAPVLPGGYVWHVDPDGGAVFATPGGALLWPRTAVGHAEQLCRWDSGGEY
jgi:hypothetical protein